MFDNKFRDNSVGIAMNYGMDGRGSNLDKDIFFSTVSTLVPGSNGYRGLIACESSGRSMKLTTHLHLVTTSRPHDLHAPIGLHGIVLN
jgi:hypothetical protein